MLGLGECYRLGRGVVDWDAPESGILCLLVLCVGVVVCIADNPLCLLDWVHQWMCWKKTCDGEESAIS